MGHPLALLGVFLCGLLVSIGTFWSFSRGGHDFAVFYHAWNLVLNGHGMEIYRVSPDRYLYAPGFAWLFAPIAWIPKGWALGLWCLAKAGALGYVIREFPARWLKDPLVALGVGAWGVVLLARPLLIDFEYGQVNVFILAMCVWALLGHFDRGKATVFDFLKWFVLAFAAFTKIFALPLLVLPFIPWGQTIRELPEIRKRVARERLGVILGFACIVLEPIVLNGWTAGIELYRGWGEALVMKGLPLESHNQSFTAFLHHYLSGNPTPVFLQGGSAIVFGFSVLSPSAISVLSVAWMALICGVIVLGFLRVQGEVPARWIAIMIGLLVLPSHLIWKPYFAMGIPLAILAVQRYQKRPWVLFVFFALVNLTTYDVVGRELAGRLESGALLLWTHLLLFILVLWKPLRLKNQWAD